MDKEDITSYDTLVREVFEETFFDLKPHRNQLKHLGQFDYLLWKKLDLFYLKLNELPPL